MCIPFFFPIELGFELFIFFPGA
jgi:hypothetical protein